MKKKLGLASIILLGINSIIGSGIFLLPGKAVAEIGVASIFVFIFDALLVVSIGLCFAQVSGFFGKNGGLYVYAKEAFGDFVGFEVGFIKWIISMIAWATMSVALTTILATMIPALSHPSTQKVVTVGIIILLSVINIFGVEFSKIINNVSTVGKIVPLAIFIIVGIFFIKSSNFTPLFPGGVYEKGSFWTAAILIFYAFTGVESIAMASEDMENPKKNLPRAIVMVLAIVATFYILLTTVAIGISGYDLASSETPIAMAFGQIAGNFGLWLVSVGSLISVLGINVAASFNTPRSAVALSDDGLLPQAISKRTAKSGTPYVAIIVSAIIVIPIALSGSFTTLAAISVVSRFAQYIPTCLSVLVFKKKRPDLVPPFALPFGPVIPIVAVVVSVYLLTQASSEQLIWGLGGLVIAAPFYFLMKYLNRDKVVGEK